MKTIFKLHSLFESETRPDLLRRLASIYPEGRIDDYFECQLDVTDPRAEAVQVALAESGYRAWARFSGKCDDSCEYWLELIRTYEAVDLDGRPVLELHPEALNRGFHRRETDGQIELTGPEPSPVPAFARAGMSRCVVPERTKLLLEGAGLVGIAFRPTVAAGRQTQTWWELYSTVQMPPLSDTMELRESDGVLAPRDGSLADIFPVDGNYQHPQLRYHHRDLDRMPSFDLAHTWEMLGGDLYWHSTPSMDRRLIASQRFYQFCLTHDLKTEWVPVRIDPDDSAESSAGGS